MHRDPMEGTPDDVPVYQCDEHGYQADDYPCEICAERREREERELDAAAAGAAMTDFFIRKLGGMR